MQGLYSGVIPPSTSKPPVSSKTRRSRRMYSAAAFRVSTLLGLRSRGMRGTMVFSFEKPLFRFLICQEEINRVTPQGDPRQGDSRIKLGPPRIKLGPQD